LIESRLCLCSHAFAFLGEVIFYEGDEPEDVVTGGTVSPYIEQGIMDWVCKLGEPFALAAMKRMAERGKTSWD